MSFSRPTPDQFATEREFLDAASAYVKRVTAENKAYGKKIDRAVDYQHATTTIHREHKKIRSVSQDKTFHDILNASPVLRAMHKQGRLF